MSFNTKVGFVKDKLIESKWTKNFVCSFVSNQLILVHSFLRSWTFEKIFRAQEVCIINTRHIFNVQKFSCLSSTKSQLTGLHLWLYQISIFSGNLLCIVKVVQQQYHLSVGQCCFSRDSWIHNIILNWLCERVLGSKFQF